MPCLAKTKNKKTTPYSTTPDTSVENSHTKCLDHNIEKKAEKQDEKNKRQHFYE